VRHPQRLWRESGNLAQDRRPHGLHDHPARLRQRLQTEVDKLAAIPGVTHILLAYGRCGDGLVGLRSGLVTLVLPRAHDCISILLGGPDCHEAILRENPTVYFYSPGWIRGHRVPVPDREKHTREFYTARNPDDPETVDDLLAADTELFARHDCVAYVDLTNDSVAENYCRGCARHLGWRFRKLNGDAALLSNLLSGPWPAAHFVVAPPGHVFALAPGGELAATATSP